MYGSFDRWLAVLDRYAGPDLTYFNASGVIPASAIIERGTRRSNPFRERRKFDATDFTEGAAAEMAFIGAEGEEGSGDEKDEEGDGDVNVKMGKKELEEAEG